MGSAPSRPACSREKRALSPDAVITDEGDNAVLAGAAADDIVVAFDGNVGPRFVPADVDHVVVLGGDGLCNRQQVAPLRICHCRPRFPPT